MISISFTDSVVDVSYSEWQVLYCIIVSHRISFWLCCTCSTYITDMATVNNCRRVSLTAVAV